MTGSCTTIWNGANANSVQVQSTYTDIIQLEITGSTIQFGENPGTSPYGNYDSLQKSYLHDAFTSCSTLKVGLGGEVYTSFTATGVLIDSNVINNIGVPGGCPGYVGGGPHGIYIAGYHVQVTNNLVSNVEDYGIHSYHNACENNISNNTVVHNYAGGILVSAGPDTSYGCNSLGGDYDTVDNNISIYNSWGCGVIDSAGNPGIANGIVVYNIGSTATHNVGYNNYLIGNWNFTGSPGCTSSPGTNNAWIYSDYTGSPFAGVSSTTLGATDVPANGFVNPCPSSTWNSIACNVVPIARGGTWDWHIVSDGAFDGMGGSACAGSPGYGSPCVPTYDADGIARTSPSSIGAY